MPEERSTVTAPRIGELEPLVTCFVRRLNAVSKSPTEEGAFASARVPVRAGCRRRAIAITSPSVVRVRGHGLAVAACDRAARARPHRPVWLNEGRYVMRPRIVLGILSAALVVSAFAATAPASARPVGSQNRPRVRIVDFKFKPGTLGISVGQTVKWINKSATTNHTTTSDSGLWDSGPLAPGDHFTFKFTKAGSFTYHCSIHPFMTGTIVVNSG
jgi:plastocyanin